VTVYDDDDDDDNYDIKLTTARNSQWLQHYKRTHARTHTHDMTHTTRKYYSLHSNTLHVLTASAIYVTVVIHGCREWIIFPVLLQ